MFKHTWSIGLIFAGAAIGLTAPASAQTLSSGDYEQCKVTNDRGNFVGFDSVCLERKRATINRLQNGDYRDHHGRRHHSRDRDDDDDDGYRYHGRAQVNLYAVTPYRCPYWANGGNGYNMTFYSNGQPPSYFGTYDSTLNGRICLPNPTYLGRGYY